MQIVPGSAINVRMIMRTFRLTFVHVIVTCTLMATVQLLPVLNATPASADRGIRVEVKRVGSKSLQPTVTANVPRRSTCTLHASAKRQRQQLPSATAVAKKVGWTWTVTAGAPRGMWSFKVVCKRHGKKVRVLRTHRRIVPARGPRAGLMSTGTAVIGPGKALGKTRSDQGDDGGEDTAGKGAGVGNPFAAKDKGWCTYGAWELAPWLGNAVTSVNGQKVSGNAKNWDDNARANGFKVDTRPVVGAVYVSNKGYYGHVGVVTEVNAQGQFRIKEMNQGTRQMTRAEYDKYGIWATTGVPFQSWMMIDGAYTRGFGKYSMSNWMSVDPGIMTFIYQPGHAPGEYEGHIVQWDADSKSQKTAWYVQGGKRYWIPTSAIYHCLKVLGAPGPDVLASSILDTYPDQSGRWARCSNGSVGVGSGSPPTDPPSGSPTGPPTQPIARVWAEQQGSHGANTFSNPYNASGLGPKIAPYQWVDVSCKVYAPQIASANPDGYWYRIKSGPWNDAYYAVANTFWNGDVPGQRPYTHNTDFNVPDC